MISNLLTTEEEATNYCGKHGYDNCEACSGNIKSASIEHSRHLGDELFLALRGDTKMREATMQKREARFHYDDTASNKRKSLGDELFKALGGSN